ncbi:MAG: phosphoribosyl-ATP diphosphatase, partial [Steroidobacteraceae bacterium]
KVGEEGLELALASASGEDRDVIAESADLLYHLLLMLKSRNLSIELVVNELESRHQHRAPK